jgi:hypothetical protein
MVDAPAFVPAADKMAPAMAEELRKPDMDRKDVARKDTARKDIARKVKLCPICGRPESGETRPFCSPRCRDVDLNRWLKGSYVIPASDNDDEDSE